MIPKAIFDYEHRGEPAPWPPQEAIVGGPCIACALQIEPGMLYVRRADGPYHIHCADVQSRRRR